MRSVDLKTEYEDWEGEESCARHLISSVGVEIREETRPPMMPARKADQRGGRWSGFEMGTGERMDRVRL